MTQDQAITDVKQAKAVGLDAFALNVMDSSAQYAMNTIKWVFDAAAQNDFKLFFSIDMIHFNNPSQFLPLVESYLDHSAYYHYDSKPFVSTFNGGTMNFGASSVDAGWKQYFTSVLAAKGKPIFFVPNFDDSKVQPSNFFNDFPSLDGVMGWDTAWPWQGDSYKNVSSSVDAAYLSSAQQKKKVYMMRKRLLPFDFPSLSFAFLCSSSAFFSFV
jgi:glucan endo-1,3-alpha-glucosidase